MTTNNFEFSPPQKAKPMFSDPNALYIPKRKSEWLNINLTIPSAFTVWEKIIIDEPINLDEMIERF